MTRLRHLMHLDRFICPTNIDEARPASQGAQTLAQAVCPEEERENGLAKKHWDGTLEHLFALGWLVIDPDGHLLWTHTVSRETQRPTLMWRSQVYSPAKLIWELSGRDPIPTGFTVRHNLAVCQHRRCVDYRHHYLYRHHREPAVGLLSNHVFSAYLGNGGDSSAPATTLDVVRDGPTRWNGSLGHLFELAWISIQGDHWIWNHTVKEDGRPVLKWCSRVLNPSRLVWVLSGQASIPRSFTVKHNTDLCSIQRCVHFSHHFLFKQSSGRPCVDRSV